MKVSTKLYSKLIGTWQFGLLSASIVATSLVYANDCGYSMGVACPPNLDPQSYVSGLEVQLNGGVGPENPICPPVSHIYWDWGDGNFEEAFFPAYHEYSSSGEYTILVFATDSSDEVVAEASCTLSVGEIIACSGFYDPMADYPVVAKKNRVFPLKMDLFDGDGFALSSDDLVESPIVQVMFASAGGDPAIDVSTDVQWSGQGSEGNQFVFTDDGIWQFNLKSKNYAASGEYMVTVVSGDDSEYAIDPACVTSFQIK